MMSWLLGRWYGITAATRCWRHGHEWAYVWSNAAQGSSWWECERCGLDKNYRTGLNLQDWP